jgi:protein-disulfide isomerase
MRIATVLLTLAAAGAALSGTSPHGRTEGVPNAPITIEVYSDFQCPSCKTFHEHGLNSLRYDYVSKGKVLLVFRQFPLPMHAHAKQASSLACAAAKVGKYSEVANALFSKQTDWANTGKVEDTASSVLPPAVAQKVRTLAKDPAVVAEIQSDMQLGRSSGIDSTPSLVITARQRRLSPISANANYNIIKATLDGLLAK